MPNPIATRLRRWIPTTFGPELHIIAADEIDRLTRELEAALQPRT